MIATAPARASAQPLNASSATTTTRAGTAAARDQPRRTRVAAPIAPTYTTTNRLVGMVTSSAVLTNRNACSPRTTRPVAAIAK
jgi:hypothetical protein